MAMYEGIGGVARQVANMYEGIGGVARQIVKGWEGIGGVAREFFGSGLILYDNGSAPYGVYTRSNTGASARGTIGSNSVYLNTTYIIGDTYGNSGLSSYLCCPSFYIPTTNFISQIDNYSKIKCTFQIDSFSSTTGQNNGVKITFGGFYYWHYDDEGYKTDPVYWKLQSSSYTSTGTYTIELNLTNTIKNTMKSNSSSYPNVGFTFGAYTHTTSSTDERNWYCRAVVHFKHIELC